MKIKENLSPLVTFPNDNTFLTNNFQFQSGKVYGIILNENSPLFKENGEWDGLGTIFYLDYENARNTENVNLATCKRAKPFFPQQKYYPLIGEIVLIFDLPSPTSQISNNFTQKYYVSTINLWNNVHHNAQSSTGEIKLGNTFTEKSNINTLLPFEGDLTIEGRFSNSIRLSSTSKNNTWSRSGNIGDPIIILSNNHHISSSKDINPCIEDINKDGSSFYLTSTQQIDLKTDKTELNKLTKPIKPSEYKFSQTILNADRLLLNSKKDDVLIFAKSNIELYTKNVINLNGDERVVIDSPRIFLGLDKNKELPTEPVLLGNKTVLLLNDLIKELTIFCNKLSQAKSTPQGTPILEITTAASAMATKLNKISRDLSKITSKNTYTI
ncbi:MAG TPA: hypothetical protein VFV86_09470 [Nitrososphaeraceae archaeon]|nr:hypothetical protein [Nitrososphaeraceae archaeon]